ncbi:DUF6337 family protein [Erwinia sp. D4-22]
MFFLFLPMGFWLDYISWKRVTPCMVAFIGIYFILLTYEIFGEYLGFILINKYVYFYILIFYLCGLFASLLVAVIFAAINKVKRPVKKFFAFEYGARSKKTIINIAIIMAILCIYNIYNAYLTLGSFVSEEFEEKLTYGFAGHCFAILMATLPFLAEIFFKERKKSLLLLIGMILILLFMKQVKYWVMIPLVWITWYAISGKFIELTFKKYFSLVVKLCLALVSLFFLVYFMKVYMSNHSGDLDYSAIIFSIAIHFFGYLFSGILTLSSYESLGIYRNLVQHDGMGLLSGFLNIFNVLSGSELLELQINRPFVVLNNLYNSSGNVPSLWGTLLLATGYYSFFWFFILIFILSLLCGLSGYSKLILLIYTFQTSFLFFAWFDYYYYLLTPYEVSAFVIIFYGLIRFLKNKTKKVNLAGSNNGYI